MTVKQLIEELQKIDPELEVLLSKDEEGNGFSPLDENYGIGYYAPYNNWSGKFYDEDAVTQEILPDEKITLEEFIEETGSKKCIALFPLN